MKHALLRIALTAILASSCAKKKDFTIIAHRGAPGYLPEHTLEGVAMAHAWNIDFIEPDLVMSKDDHLVILHDHHLDTTTNVAERFPKRARKDGRFYAIDFTLDELKSLRVHERIVLATGKPVYPQRFDSRKAFFKIPTFKEFIELVQGLNKTSGKNIGIYPEIKMPEFHISEGKDITKAAIEMMREYGYEKSLNAGIQCFWPNTLIRLKNEFKTKIPLFQLIAENEWNESSADYTQMLTDSGLKKISTYASAIGPWVQQILTIQKGIYKSTGLVERAKKLNLKVVPYTHRTDQLPQGLSEEDFFKLMFEALAVDGIFSDFADRAKKFSEI